VLFSANPNSTVSANLTTYLALGGPGFRGGGEGYVQTAMPAACTAHNLYVVTSGSQSGTGSLVVTLRKAAANTALAAVVAAGAPGGTHSDTADTVSLNSGDLIDFAVANTATATSANVVTVSVQCN
jgi:hypothetical protein